MHRGTTPTLQCSITGVDVEKLTEAWVTLRQGTKELTKTLDDLEVESETNTLNVYLTQEETLSFSSGQVRIQLRALIGDTAIASNIVAKDMSEILRDGVIE